MKPGIISCWHNKRFERDEICYDCMRLCPAAEPISPSNVRALCLNGGPGSAGDARNSDVAKSVVECTRDIHPLELYAVKIRYFV